MISSLGVRSLFYVKPLLMKILIILMWFNLGTLWFLDNALLQSRRHNLPKHTYEAARWGQDLETSGSCQDSPLTSLEPFYASCLPTGWGTWRPDLRLQVDGFLPRPVTNHLCLKLDDNVDGGKKRSWETSKGTERRQTNVSHTIDIGTGRHHESICWCMNQL